MKTSKSCSSLFVLFFFLSTPSFSQDIYPLHPSIGDTLESIEKLDYSLFPKVENTGFDYAVIKFQKERFILYTYYNSEENSIALSQEEIIEAQQNIEKINQYYRLKANQENQTEEDQSLSDRPSGKTPVYFNDVMNDQIKKEARMYLRLKEDAQRMKDHQNGISPNQLRIDFTK